MMECNNIYEFKNGEITLYTEDDNYKIIAHVTKATVTTKIGTTGTHIGAEPRGINIMLVFIGNDETKDIITDKYQEIGLNINLNTSCDTPNSAECLLARAIALYVEDYIEVLC